MKTQTRFILNRAIANGGFATEEQRKAFFARLRGGLAQGVRDIGRNIVSGGMNDDPAANLSKLESDQAGREAFVKGALSFNPIMAAGLATGDFVKGQKPSDLVFAMLGVGGWGAMDDLAWKTLARKTGIDDLAMSAIARRKFASQLDEGIIPREASHFFDDIARKADLDDLRTAYPKPTASGYTVDGLNAMSDDQLQQALRSAQLNRNKDAVDEIIEVMIARESAPALYGNRSFRGRAKAEGLSCVIANAGPMTDAQRRAMFAKEKSDYYAKNPEKHAPAARKTSSSSSMMMKDGRPVMTLKEAQRRAAEMKRLMSAKAANEAEMAHHALIQEQLRARRPVSSLDSAVPGLQMPRPVDTPQAADRGGYGRTNFMPGVGNSPKLDRLLRAYSMVIQPPPRIQTRPNPGVVHTLPVRRENSIVHTMPVREGRIGLPRPSPKHRGAPSVDPSIPRLL
jgi:hypothetical protein